MRTYEVLEKLVISRYVKDIKKNIIFNMCYCNLTSEKLCIVIDIIYKYKPNITRFYLHSNKITYIPESITLLKNIQRLGLCGNMITYIPKYIGELKYLRKLDLSYNEITDIEDNGLTKCKYLKTLDIHRNRELQYIDKHIFELPLLSHINICDTKVSEDDLAKYLMTSSLITAEIYLTEKNNNVNQCL